MSDSQKFVLPALPYGASDLAPTISSDTVDLHYGKHHQAYFNMLNNFADGTKFMDMELDQVVVESFQDGHKKVFNKIECSNSSCLDIGANIGNHSVFFANFFPSSLVTSVFIPSTPLRRNFERILSSFSTTERFRVAPTKNDENSYPIDTSCIIFT